MSDHIRDDGDLRKYRTELPNMADDDLDPYQYRLYGHYKRVCGANGGECYESVRTTAEKTKMSNEKVIATRQWLADNGWIHVEPRAKGTLNITILDRWEENFERFYDKPTVRNSEQSTRKIGTTVRNSERSPLDISNQRKNNIKNKHIDVESLDSTPTESDEGEDDEKEAPEHQQWFEALCWLVFGHKDYSLLSKTDQIAIGKTAKSIRASREGYTLVDLRNWYKNIWATEWPGRQPGKAEVQPPTLKQIKNGIGKVKKCDTPTMMAVTTKAVGVYMGTVENLR